MAEIPEIDLQDLAEPNGVPGTSPRAPINAMPPDQDFPSRFLLNLATTGRAQITRELARSGFQAAESEGEISVQSKADGRWYRFDPAGWQGFAEAGRDITDVTGDVLNMAGQTAGQAGGFALGGGPTSPMTSIPASVAGGALGAGATDFLRTKLLGGALGYEPTGEEVEKSAATEAVFGGASALLPYLLRKNPLDLLGARKSEVFQPGLATFDVAQETKPLARHFGGYRRGHGSGSPISDWQQRVAEGGSRWHGARIPPVKAQEYIDAVRDVANRKAVPPDHPKFGDILNWAKQDEKDLDEIFRSGLKSGQINRDVVADMLSSGQVDPDAVLIPGQKIPFNWRAEAKALLTQLGKTPARTAMGLLGTAMQAPERQAHKLGFAPKAYSALTKAGQKVEDLSGADASLESFLRRLANGKVSGSPWGTFQPTPKWVQKTKLERPFRITADKLEQLREKFNLHPSDRALMALLELLGGEE